MMLQDRDKRALKILGIVLPIAALIYWIGSSSSSGGSAKVVAAVESVDRNEKRIAVLRAAMATVDGKETVLHSFTGGADGIFLNGSLVQDPEGNLYGTTESSGAFGFGTVFKLAP